MYYCDKCEKKIEPDDFDGHVDMFESPTLNSDGLGIDLGPPDGMPFNITIQGSIVSHPVGQELKVMHFHEDCIVQMVRQMIAPSEDKG
jgi:hypothetical protein